MGMLEEAMRFQAIFLHDVRSAPPHRLAEICTTLLDYSAKIANTYGRPQAHYLWGSANPHNEERFSEAERIGFLAANNILFEDAEKKGFREGMTAASGLQAMATMMHAEQVARTQKVRLAILSKKYEHSRIIDLVFKMDTENKEKKPGA